MINYFKSAENLLLERGNLERALKNLNRRRERIIRQSGPSQPTAIDYSQPYVSTSDASNALTECLELVEIMREIKETEEMISEIDNVINQLSESEATLLRSWYIEGISKLEISVIMGYSSTNTIYDLRNKAVSHFAILYYGAGAIASL